MSDVRDTVAQFVREADVVDQSGQWVEERARKLFDRLVADGWSTVGVAEKHGGDGGDLDDAADIVGAAAAEGVSLPLGETGLLASRLLSLSELALPKDSSCVVPVVAPVAAALDQAAMSVDAGARRVPWARWASHFLLPVPLPANRSCVVLVNAGDATVTAGENLAGEPADDVTISGRAAICGGASELSYDDLLFDLRLQGALLRSVQIAASLEQVLEMTVRYCSERVQFGRPIATFQAVQQQLAELAGEVAAASAAARTAVAAALDDSRRPVVIAAAKARTGAAAGAGAKIAHQLHGAIGVTQEYQLHRYTRALWSWRDEYGSESVWARELARRAAGAEGGDVWAWITSP